MLSHFSLKNLWMLFHLKMLSNLKMLFHLKMEHYNIEEIEEEITLKDFSRKYMEHYIEEIYFDSLFKDSPKAQNTWKMILEKLREEISLLEDHYNILSL